MFWWKFATTNPLRMFLSNNKMAMFEHWIPESAPNISSNIQNYVYHTSTFPWQPAIDSLQNVCKMEKASFWYSMRMFETNITRLMWKLHCQQQSFFFKSLKTKLLRSKFSWLNHKKMIHNCYTSLKFDILK